MRTFSAWNLFYSQGLGLVKDFAAEALWQLWKPLQIPEDSIMYQDDWEDDDETTTTVTEVGLRLPDGRVVWPPDEYKGYPLLTADDRSNLLEVLQKTADDLSFTPEEFLRHYRWVQRVLTTRRVARETGRLPIDSPEAFAGAEEDRDAGGEDHHNRTVHAGSLGGPEEGNL